MKCLFPQNWSLRSIAIVSNGPSCITLDPSIILDSCTVFDFVFCRVFYQDWLFSDFCSCLLPINLHLRVIFDSSTAFTYLLTFLEMLIWRSIVDGCELIGLRTSPMNSSFSCVICSIDTPNISTIFKFGSRCCWSSIIIKMRTFLLHSHGFPLLL